MLALLAGVIPLAATPTSDFDASQSAPALVAIDVTPINPSVAAGQTRQFAATGLFADGTRQDLTDTVIWSSSNQSVAVISDDAGSKGLATGIAPGTTEIGARYGSVADATTLTVTDAQLVTIEVTPINPSVAVGQTRQFTATGLFSDGTTQDLTGRVTWSSSNQSVAVISDDAGSKGLATGIAPGTTEIGARYGSVADETTLTVTDAQLVTIEVTPINPSVAVGQTRQFTATGLFSDGTTQDLTGRVTWSSSNRAVARISNANRSAGLATGLGAGPAEIGAHYGSVADATTLTVTDALLVTIEVTPANSSVAAGQTRQFTATGLFSDGTTQDLTGRVTWSSSDRAVARISNANGSAGLATGLGAGSTEIGARYGSVADATTLTVTDTELVTIEVTPANSSVAAGQTRQFTATGLFADGTTQDLTGRVTWSSSDRAVARISNANGSSGLATGLGAGSTEIGARYGSVADATTLTVTDAQLVTIEVTPINSSVAVGQTRQFTATGLFADGTTQDLTGRVTWSSSDRAVARVSNANRSAGLATGLGAGSTEIGARYGSVAGATTLSVNWR